MYCVPQAVKVQVTRGLRPNDRNGLYVTESGALPSACLPLCNES